MRTLILWFMLLFHERKILCLVLWSGFTTASHAQTRRNINAHTHTHSHTYWSVKTDTDCWLCSSFFHKITSLLCAPRGSERRVRVSLHSQHYGHLARPLRCWCRVLCAMLADAPANKCALIVIYHRRALEHRWTMNMHMPLARDLCPIRTWCVCSSRAYMVNLNVAHSSCGLW